MFNLGPWLVASISVGTYVDSLLNVPSWFLGVLLILVGSSYHLLLGTIVVSRRLGNRIFFIHNHGFDLGILSPVFVSAGCHVASSGAPS